MAVKSESGVWPLVRDPVAILAAGVITPLGADLDAFWTALVTGADGISSIDRFPVGDLRVQRGGEIKKLAGAESRPRGGRATQLLQAAAADLCARFRLDVTPRASGGGRGYRSRWCGGGRPRLGRTTCQGRTGQRPLRHAGPGVGPFSRRPRTHIDRGERVSQEPRPSGSVPICSATTAPIS